MARPTKILGVFAAVWLLQSGFTGCDPEHRKRCEWFLIPDPDRKVEKGLEQGYIPVCARNLQVNKEDCRFQATLEFAESAWEKRFRYVDIKYEGVKLPRKITTITYCQP